MDEQTFQDLAAKALQKPGRPKGRPLGSFNYGGLSLIARTMKSKGIHWVSEMIDAYSLYKKQWAKNIDDPTLPAPNPDLLYFWMEIMPYITVKMIDRETRGERPKYWRNKKTQVSHAAITALAKAEGRKL